MLFLVNTSEEIFNYIDFGYVMNRIKPKISSIDISKEDDVVRDVDEYEKIRNDVNFSDSVIKNNKSLGNINNSDDSIHKKEKENATQRLEEIDSNIENFFNSFEYIDILKNLKEEQVDVINEVERDKSSVEKLINLCWILERENKNLKQKIDRINKENERYKAEINKLQNENADLKKKITELQKIVDEMDRIKQGAIIDEKHRKKLMKKYKILKNIIKKNKRYSEIEKIIEKIYINKYKYLFFELLLEKINNKNRKYDFDLEKKFLERIEKIIEERDEINGQKELLELNLREIKEENKKNMQKVDLLNGENKNLQKEKQYVEGLNFRIKNKYILLIEENNKLNNEMSNLINLNEGLVSEKQELNEKLIKVVVRKGLENGRHKRQNNMLALENVKLNESLEKYQEELKNLKNENLDLNSNVINNQNLKNQIEKLNDFLPKRKEENKACN